MNILSEEYLTMRDKSRREGMREIHGINAGRREINRESVQGKREVELLIGFVMHNRKFNNTSYIL